MKSMIHRRLCSSVRKNINNDDKSNNKMLTLFKTNIEVPACEPKSEKKKNCRFQKVGKREN